MQSFLLGCKPQGSVAGEEDFGKAVQDEAGQARLSTMFENLYPRLEPLGVMPLKGLAFVLLILDTMT